MRGGWPSAGAGPAGTEVTAALIRVDPDEGTGGARRPFARPTTMPTCPRRLSLPKTRSPGSKVCRAGGVYCCWATRGSWMPAVSWRLDDRNSRSFLALLHPSGRGCRSGRSRSAPQRRPLSWVRPKTQTARPQFRAGFLARVRSRAVRRRGRGRPSRAPARHRRDRGCRRGRRPGCRLGHRCSQAGSRPRRSRRLSSSGRLCRLRRRQRHTASTFQRGIASARQLRLR